MKLSEAIRKGLALVPDQAIGSFFSNINGKLCACTIGRAYVGITGVVPEYPYPDGSHICQVVHTACEITSNELIVSPRLTAYNRLQFLLHETIALNDEEQWDSEQIAAYLEDHGY